MLTQRPGQSLTDYVHFMRHTFDDYNEICELIDGYATIHPHNLGMLMLRGVSNNGPFGQAKQSVINAFNTNYRLFADEVMASILHLAHNMDEEVAAPGLPAQDTSAPPISAFVVAGRASNSGRGHNSRDCTRGGRGLPNKCSACSSLNHIISSCTASDDALMQETLAKRRMSVKEYGTLGGSASAHTTLLSDVPIDDVDVLPTLEECTNEYDDTEVSVPFTSVAFSSSIARSRDLSQFWVVYSACSINLIAFRHDLLVTFDPPPTPFRVGGVGVDVQGSCIVRLSILLVSSQIFRHTVHALCTRDLSFHST
jgi:hypothetical protein